MPVGKPFRNSISPLAFQDLRQEGITLRRDVVARGVDSQIGQE